LSTVSNSAIIASVSSSAEWAVPLAADCSRDATRAFTASIVVATLGIQKPTACPVATYACCANRKSARASVASRACWSNARTIVLEVAISFSVRMRKTAARPTIIKAAAAKISLAALDRIEDL
jgi:hypothetical protein